MKKFIKICTVVGIICCIIGLGLTATASALGANWSSWWGPVENYLDIYSDSDHQGKVESFSNINKLQIELTAGQVEILESNSEQIEIYYGDSGKAYQTSLEDGDVLKIRCKKIGKINQMRQIQVLVPKGYQFGEVELDVTGGKFIAESLITDSLDIDLAAGSVEIKNGEVKRLQADCNAGSMEYEGWIHGDVEAECRVGNILFDVFGNESDFNYNLESAMGKIQIGDYVYAGFDREKNIYNQSNSTMELSCTTGSIEVQFEK